MLSIPAFGTPTKFVGPIYDREHAQRLTAATGWSFQADGERWRRVVPSPQPQRIVERRALRQLMAMQALVICGGGGGVPVVEKSTGELIGVEAVVDKDLTAAAIAIDANADRLLLLTDVPAVMRDFGTSHATELRRIDTDQLAGMHFPEGSMGPKVDACRRFSTATGQPAAIGSLTDASAVLRGAAGTTITASKAAHTSRQEIATQEVLHDHAAGYRT